MIKRAMDNTAVMLPAILTVLVLAVFILRFVQYTPANEIFILRDDWEITYDGKTYEGKSLRDLSDILPQTLKQNETVRIERTLDMKEIPSPTLEVIVYYLGVEVTLDGEIIASPGMEKLRAGTCVGGNQYYINVPAGFTGKKLAVTYYNGEEHNTAFIYSIRFGSFHDLVWTFFHEFGYVLVSGVFLCFFGGFFLVFSLLFSILLPEIKGQRISSVLCILLGIWILTHYRMFSFFTGSRYTTTVEYASFYMVLPLLYLLVIQVHKTSRLFRAVAIVNTMLVLISYVLHFTNIYHMHRFRNLYFSMCILYLALLLWSDIQALREKERDPVLMLQLGGPTFFCLMIFIAMLIYMFSGGDSAEYTDFSVVLLTTGPLVFAMSRFVIYIRMLAEMAPHKLEFKSLDTLAYVDALTGLNNRTLMGELEEKLDAGDQDYCLISLDLNGLKLVNDTAGHTEGDKLLKEFAHVLREAFPQEAQRMRIGGDEFLVVWENAGEERVKRCLQEMEIKFAALDTGSDIIHSTAYGYAFRHEAGEDGTFHGVFMEADRRMYDHKYQRERR